MVVIINTRSKILTNLFIKFDSNARCLIVRSTSPGIFCAGADLKERKDIPPEEVGPLVARARKFFREFQEMPIPTICALDGHALGGGIEWAMGHDLRLILVFLH